MPTTIPPWIYRFSSDHRSQARSGQVSTWMGDRLGTPGVVGFTLFYYFFAYAKPPTWLLGVLRRGSKLMNTKSLSLLGLLAKIKCSICSYQLNIWYAPKGAQILNWFLEMVRGSEACFTPGTGCPGIAVPPWMAHPLLVINWNLSRILQSLIFLQACSTAQDFLKSSRFVSYVFSWVVFNLKNSCKGSGFLDSIFNFLIIVILFCRPVSQAWSHIYPFGLFQNMVSCFILKIVNYVQVLTNLWICRPSFFSFL